MQECGDSDYGFRMNQRRPPGPLCSTDRARKLEPRLCSGAQNAKYVLCPN